VPHEPSSSVHVFPLFKEPIIPPSPPQIYQKIPSTDPSSNKTQQIIASIRTMSLPGGPGRGLFGVEFGFWFFPPFLLDGLPDYF